MIQAEGPIILLLVLCVSCVCLCVSVWVLILLMCCGLQSEYNCSARCHLISSSWPADTPASLKWFYRPQLQNNSVITSLDFKRLRWKTTNMSWEETNGSSLFLWACQPKVKLLLLNTPHLQSFTHNKPMKNPGTWVIIQSGVVCLGFFC